MTNTLRRVVLILLLCVIVYVVVSSILSFLFRIFTVVLIGAVILFLLSLGSRSDSTD